ncbi:hypothetical protein BJX76DRAFT_362145 [Aspergillus varians]
MSNLADEDEFDDPCQTYLDSGSSLNILSCQTLNEHDTQDLLFGPQRFIGSNLHVDPSVILPVGNMESQPECPQYEIDDTRSEIWQAVNCQPTYPGATRPAAATDDGLSFEEIYSNVTQPFLPQPPADLFEQQFALVGPTDLDFAMNLGTDIGHVSSSAHQEQDFTVPRSVSQPLGLHNFEEYIDYPDNTPLMAQDPDGTFFEADSFLSQFPSQHVPLPILGSTDLMDVDHHIEFPDAIALATSQLDQHNVEAGQSVMADIPSWNSKASFTTQNLQDQAPLFPNQVIAKPFGPSHPVELLPKQKSKRRPMSEQEKKNAAQARRTACWRCKRNKKKLEKAPLELLQNFEGPGMYFFALPGEDGDIERWLNTRILFSFFGYLTYRGMRNFSIDFPAEFQPRQVRETAMLNIWLAMRQSEIEVFQYLERVVNDDLSSLDSSQTRIVIRAMALCIIAGSGLARDQYPAFFEDLDESIPLEFAHDLKDRQERIRTALFVYLTILVTTKLPKGTVFWDLFKGIGPIDQVRQEFQQCLDNLELFTSGFECWEQHLRTHTTGFRNHYEALSNLDPSNYPSLEDLKNDSDEDNQDYFTDDLQGFIERGEIATLPDSMDLHITGGLLHAISSDSSSELSFLIFAPIPTIDWTKAFTPIYHQGTHDLNDHSLHRLGIACQIIQRSQRVHLARVFRACLSRTEVSMSDFLISLSSSIDDLSPDLTSRVPQLTRETVREALSKLREGDRWLELIDLTGFEEILLVQRAHIGIFASGTPLQRFDIPQIITDGAECDFNRLKFLLTTSFSWVSDTCTQLDGFVDLFLHCQKLFALGDIETAQISGCQLQEKVTKCFGTTDHIQTTQDQLFTRFRKYMEVPMAELQAELPSDDEIGAIAAELEIRPRRANESQAGTEDPADDALTFKILFVLLSVYVGDPDLLRV